MTLDEKLEAYSELVTESGCKIWMRAVMNRGYGVMHNKGKVVLVHRLVWECAYGSIPPKMFVCHRCDVRCCINPTHLFLGTNTDNMKDASLKGRLKKSIALRVKARHWMMGNTNGIGHRCSVETRLKMRQSALLREARKRGEIQ